MKVYYLLTICFALVEASALGTDSITAVGAAAVTSGSLPGKGLAHHDFLYSGEWDTRKTNQTMFLIKGGKVVWTYEIPIKDVNGNLSEYSTISRPARPSWNTQVKTKEPVDTKSIHGQFRNVRMTKAGTYLIAHMNLGKVIEYDQDWKEIWSCDAPSDWHATRLKNGNTLISGNQHGFVREINPKGEIVWEVKKGT